MDKPVCSYLPVFLAFSPFLFKKNVLNYTFQLTKLKFDSATELECFGPYFSCKSCFLAVSHLWTRVKSKRRNSVMLVLMMLVSRCIKTNTFSSNPGLQGDRHPPTTTTTHTHTNTHTTSFWFGCNIYWICWLLSDFWRKQPLRYSGGEEVRGAGGPVHPSVSREVVSRWHRYEVGDPRLRAARWKHRLPHIGQQMVT